MRGQLERLVHRGFVGEFGLERLRHLPRYLAALQQRRERLAEQPARDAELMGRVQDLQQAWLHRRDALPDGMPLDTTLREVRWLLEEYRVSLWAQQLGTAQAVSDRRIRKALHVG
jgi:ATP-dependent helicase HrpA